MSRTATDSLWRAARRVVDILDANLGAEVTSDTPAGLNVSAPASAQYYILADARSVVRHQANGNPRCYVYFDGDQDRTNYTRGPVTRPSRQVFNVGVAFFVQVEAGAADYAETWKTLDTEERELLRALTLDGAAGDVLDGNVRNADDVLNATHVRTRVSPPDGSPQPETGTWVHTVWRISHKINRVQQN